MGQRRHHYERAFAAMLRTLRVPFVSVNEAKRTLLPGADAGRSDAAKSLKNFDFVLYGPGTNLLVDVKGRRLAPAARASARAKTVRRGVPRLESWVSEEDVRSILAWNALFGPDFEAAFVFFYSSDEPPAGDVFDETFRFEGRWYAPKLISAADYAKWMKPRSARWRTVDLEHAAFEEFSGPLRSLEGGLAAQNAGPNAPTSPWVEPYRVEDQSADLTSAWSY